MSGTESLRPWAVRAKKHYSVREIYAITHDAVSSAGHFARLRRARGERYTERIMLAVTEVNGCALCAYGHARYALQAGLGAEEVRELLGGTSTAVPDDQLAAIAFAQHYADTRGRPDQHAWDRLVEAYGEDDALGVLGAIRMIMWGNAVGIPYSSLLARLAGRADPGSTLRYETATILGTLGLVPAAAAHAVLSARRAGAAPRGRPESSVVRPAVAARRG